MHSMIFYGVKEAQVLVDQWVRHTPPGHTTHWDTNRQRQKQSSKYPFGIYTR